MADHYWKRHDTAPALVFAFTDLNGATPPGDLTGATVTFTMNAVGSNTPKINRGTATIVDVASWQLGYQPVTGDTDTSGSFNGEFEVVFSDGKKQTLPDPGTISIQISDDLDAT